MALVDCSLSNDDLLAFLSEIDGDWLMDSDPVTSPPVDVKPRTRKPRKSRRLDLINIRQEIAQLQFQLQLLQEKVAFRESLNVNRSSCGLSWKYFALREKTLKMRTAEENARLRRRVAVETKVTRRILALVRHQAETVPRSVRINRCAERIDLKNEEQVSRVLRACIDLRCVGDLDVIAQQCDEESVVSDSNLERSQWKTFALKDHGVGVEFREAVAMPFSAATIHRANRRHIVINAVEECKGNVTHKPMLKHRCPQSIDTGLTATMDRRLILRRIANVQKGPILLWEDASFWQNSATTAHMFVRSSGWAYVSPALSHEDEMSFVYCGGRIQIHTTDGSPLKTACAEVKHIVKCMQSLQRSRVSCMEEFLLLQLELK